MSDSNGVILNLSRNVQTRFIRIRIVKKIVAFGQLRFGQLLVFGQMFFSAKKLSFKFVRFGGYSDYRARVSFHRLGFDPGECNCSFVYIGFNGDFVTVRVEFFVSFVKIC
jgi:hypothetical protein